MDMRTVPAFLAPLRGVTMEATQGLCFVVQSFVRNQGDGWTWVLNSLNQIADAQARRGQWRIGS